MYDLWAPHDPVKLDTGSETIVEQCHEETTNINKIIGRYRQSGVLPEHRQGAYIDTTQVGELMDIKLMMSEMQQSYENLPDNVKEKLPFADIGNVSDETLKELFSNDDTQANQTQDGRTQIPTGDSQDKPRADDKKQSADNPTADRDQQPRE